MRSSSCDRTHLHTHTHPYIHTHLIQAPVPDSIEPNLEEETSALLCETGSVAFTTLLFLWCVRNIQESTWEPVHYLVIYYLTIFSAKFSKTISKSNFNGSIFPDSAIHVHLPGHRVVLCDFPFQYLCFMQTLPFLKTLFLLITSIIATDPSDLPLTPCLTILCVSE